MNSIAVSANAEEISTALIGLVRNTVASPCEINIARRKWTSTIGPK
jgi:hypothetical protein